MRMRNVLALAVSLALATVVLAQDSGEKKAKMAPKAKAAGGATIMQAADMKWVDLDPTGAPGVKVADVWGDHTKGAFGAFTKFPAGWSTPVHTHTHTFKIVVLSGTWIHTPEGKPEVRMGPGSYLVQPGGGYRHTSACDKASECEIFNVSDGKFDLIPVEAAKAPAKK